MSQRKVKRVRQQVRKHKLRIGLQVLDEITELPFRKRLYFAWLIFTGRRFN